MIRKCKSSLAILIIIASIILVVFLVQKPRSAYKARIGYLNISNSLPLFVAQEKGLFRQFGVDVVLTNYQTSNDLIEAFVAGRIDIQVSASVSVIYAMENRAPRQSRIFSVNVQTKEYFPDYLIVRKGANILKLADLRGKRLAIFPGSTFLIITRIILASVDLKPEDLIIEPLLPPSQLEALESGRVDAIYTLEPFATIALSRGNSDVLEAAPAEKHVLDPLPGGAASMRLDFIKQRPEISNGIIRAFDEAIALIRSDEKIARSYLPLYTTITKELSTKVGISAFWKSNEINVVNLQKYADILFKSGDIRRPVQVEKLVKND